MYVCSVIYFRVESKVNIFPVSDTINLEFNIHILRYTEIYRFKYAWHIGNVDRCSYRGWLQMIIIGYQSINEVNWIIIQKLNIEKSHPQIQLPPPPIHGLLDTAATKDSILRPIQVHTTRQTSEVWQVYHLCGQFAW